MPYTHENEIVGGKGVAQVFNGRTIALECPDAPEEAVGEGRLYADARSLVRAANRTANVNRNTEIRAVLTKWTKEHGENLTPEQVEQALAEAATAARAYQFKARIVDPNAPKKEKSSGEVKRAKEVAGKADAALEKAIREGNTKRLRTMVEMEIYTQADIDAARARIEKEATQASA